MHSPHFSPQTESTAFTQSPSQLPLQQNGSSWQIDAAHGPQPGSSAGPTTQTSCVQGLPRQTPFEQRPEQHSSGELHMRPLPVHCPMPQTPLLHEPLQQSKPDRQLPPSGTHWLNPQPPSLQAPLQHWTLSKQAEPSGRHVSLQRPWKQPPLQHWLPTMQLAPFGKHGPNPQTLF